MHALHGTRGVALCHTAVISTFVPNVGQVIIKTAIVLALLSTDQWSRRVQSHQGRELLSVRQDLVRTQGVEFSYLSLY